jgi:hypothetical protein
MSVFEENVRLLRSRHPSLPPAVLAPESEWGSALVVTPSASGQPTALYHGTQLHSRYDPKKEAETLVGRKTARDATAGIILGFGLGYAAEAFHRMFPSLPLVVVEPDCAVFSAALRSRDLSFLLNCGTVRFLIGTRLEEVTALLEGLPMEKPAFLRLRPSLERNPGYFTAVEQIAGSFILRRDININTLNRFGRLWVRNLAANMRLFLESPGASLFSGLFTGLPALLLAGGPSFDRIVPRLKELYERFLVVSVETPLRACLDAGVKPDFVVMVDPQYWATRYLDATDGYDGFLVAEPSTHPRTFRWPGRHYILTGSLFPLGEYLESRMGQKGRLGAGGSVATAAWDLCRLLGAQEIYTAGLDLGFPGLRTHFRGAFFEEAWFASAGKLSPVEGHSFRYLREIGVFPMASNGARPVLTDRRMLLYKWWFESQLAAPSSPKTASLSEDALAIKGMPFIPLEEALSMPPRRLDIERGMEKARTAAAAAGNRRESAREKLVEALDELMGNLRTLENLGLRGLSATKGFARALKRREDAGRELARLDEVDRGILELSTRNIAGFLIQPLIHGIVGGKTAKAEEAEVLATSRRMYEGIVDSARFHRTVLARSRESFT